MRATIGVRSVSIGAGKQPEESQPAGFSMPTFPVAAPPASSGARDLLGAWLAGNAHLEAASIDAFEILATELRAHRAPPVLIEAARTATADERRHADSIGGLASSRGAVPPGLHVNRSPIRDIEAVARENAIENCVRETYAALLAYRQASAAADPAIRSRTSVKSSVCGPPSN
jgi:hypothetical protein